MSESSVLKKQFPIFETWPDLLFADNASTTHKPSLVIDAVSNFYTSSNANVHRAVYELGIEADEIYESSRQSIANYYGKEQCVFTSGTTDGINKIARGLEKQLSSGDNILVSEMEHHSNLIPWQELCKRTGAQLRMIEITKEGGLDLDQLEELLDKRTRIVSMVHISNTLGSINELSKVPEKVKDLDCSFIVDAAQSCTLHRDEIAALRADAFVFSAHKMFGPSGVGAILAKKSFLDKIDAFDYGGGMVTEVEKYHSGYRKDISRLEGGTPPIAQIAGFGAAIEFNKSLDLGQCKNATKQMASRLRSELLNRNVECLPSLENHAGVLSVNFANIHPHDCASFLNEHQIAVRAGHHCTQLIMKKFNVPASVRFSFSIYNSLDEVERILEGIESMQKFFR